MWGKIIIPKYRLWLHGLYGLYGPWCPLSPKRPINLTSLSLGTGYLLVLATMHLMTLTLDFQGQIFKWLYLRNRVSDWQETQVIWIAAMLDPQYDLDLWPAYDLDLGFSWSNFPIVVPQEGVVCFAWNEMDMNWYDFGPTIWPWPLIPPMPLTLDFLGQISK